MEEAFLKERLLKQYNEELTNDIYHGYEQIRYPSFRVNTKKTTVIQIQNELENLGFQLKPVSFYEKAFIVLNKNEKDIYALDCFKEGKIYLQSLSSMLPVLFLDASPNDSILDMAAAPGSKTTQIFVEKDSITITAIEKNKGRKELLEYNLKKQGVTNCTVMHMDARDLDENFQFDSILLDAPCSGTGTLSISEIKNHSMLNEVRMAKICRTQKELLRCAIKVLKKGKTLVYSTCSLLEEENEDVIQAILKEMNVCIVPIVGPKGLPYLPSKIKGTLLIRPNEYFEGFFVAKIKKL